MISGFKAHQITVLPHSEGTTDPLSADAVDAAEKEKVKLVLWTSEDEDEGQHLLKIVCIF